MDTKIHETDGAIPFVIMPEIRAPSEQVAWELWAKLIDLAADLGCEVTAGGMLLASAYDAPQDDDEALLARLMRP